MEEGRGYLSKIVIGFGLALFLVLPGCGSTPRGAPLPLPPFETPTAKETDPWLILLKRTPYPYSTPLPGSDGSDMDGIYVKLDPNPATPLPCKRCADYGLQGGIWKLGFARGVYRIYSQATGWRSLGSFLAGEGSVVLFNDPYCPRVTGTYTWTLADGELAFEVLDDDCAIGLRARNLTQMPWRSCQPPNVEAGVSHHWPQPPGCD